MDPLTLQHLNVKLFLEDDPNQVAQGAGVDRSSPERKGPVVDPDSPAKSAGVHPTAPDPERIAGLDAARVVEVFHRWVSAQSIPRVLLVDVADYRHVPSGPGILLVGLEADFSLDHTGGRWGLRYNRKSVLAGSNEERLREAVRSAAKVGRMLESELGSAGLFIKDELEIYVNDRALAPNTAETWAAARPILESALERIFGHRAFTLRNEPDRRKRFGVSVRVEKPFELGAIAELDPEAGAKDP